MGAHGHSDKPPFSVPDYKTYKISDAPDLVQTERVLRSMGLKDPWLRNEVWRYNEKVWGSKQQLTRSFFLRGFSYGFAAFVVTAVGTAVYDKLFPSEHGHGEHH